MMALLSAVRLNQRLGYLPESQQICFIRLYWPVQELVHSIPRVILVSRDRHGMHFITNLIQRCVGLR